MIREPIFFERNRVWRVYTGGKLFEGLWGIGSCQKIDDLKSGRLLFK